MKPIVVAKELRKEYLSAGEQPVRALNGVALTIHQGEFVAIMGSSGSGKTTLLHLIGGLDRPTAGSVVVSGTDLAQLDDRQRTLFRRRSLGIIFQAYNLIPTLTALENVCLPAMIEGRNGADVQRRGCELLELVDLSHRIRHRPQAMSGGEQQRVSIARAMMNDPMLILADEPTGNLDTKHGTAIWELLRRLVHEHGKTVVSVTHEAAGAGFAQRVVVLRDGMIVGEIQSEGVGHAGALAARYAELVD